MARGCFLFFILVGGERSSRFPPWRTVLALQGSREVVLVSGVKP
jgi:hypothetical protein